jgi:hypothetical protein
MNWLAAKFSFDQKIIWLMLPDGFQARVVYTNPLTVINFTCYTNVASDEQKLSDRLVLLRGSVLNFLSAGVSLSKPKKQGNLAYAYGRCR